METIKFYTDTNKYMGWKKFKSFSNNWLELKGWINSGNKLVIGNNTINPHETGKLCLTLKTIVA